MIMAINFKEEINISISLNVGTIKPEHSLIDGFYWVW